VTRGPVLAPILYNTPVINIYLYGCASWCARIFKSLIAAVNRKSDWWTGWWSPSAEDVAELVRMDCGVQVCVSQCRRDVASRHWVVDLRRFEGTVSSRRERSTSQGRDAVSQKLGVVLLTPVENVSVCSHVRVRIEYVGRITAVVTL
jgi:hypothetical protein